jgi:hypothetical protein
MKQKLAAGKNSSSSGVKAGMVAATAAVLTTAASTAFAGNPTFQWVNGQVTGFTAQLPMYTVAIVDNKALRFCNPGNGYDAVHRPRAAYALGSRRMRRAAPGASLAVHLLHADAVVLQAVALVEAEVGVGGIDGLR